MATATIVNTTGVIRVAHKLYTVTQVMELPRRRMHDFKVVAAEQSIGPVSIDVEDLGNRDDRHKAAAKVTVTYNGGPRDGTFRSALKAIDWFE
jgi:hypothetical protein